MASKYKKSKESIVTPLPQQVDSRCTSKIRNRESATKCHLPIAHSTPRLSRKSFSLRPNMVKTKAICCSTKSQEDINHDSAEICLRKNQSDTELSNCEELSDNMLAVTISSVMLMASNVPTITDEYLVWAEHYLSCIKDTNGYHPPNVEGILNYIKYLRIRELSSQSSISNKTCCSFASTSRSRSSSPQKSEEKKLKPVTKFRNPSASKKSINRSFIPNTKHSNSCASFATLYNPFQKTK